MSHAKRRIGLVGLALLLVSAPAAGLQYDNGGSYLPERHDRFVPGTFPQAPVPNPGFFLADYANALAGVGWEAGAPARKVALISPQHFLNANHFQAGGAVSFLDVNGVVRTYPIASNTPVKNDIAIGTLSAPIPEEDGVPYFEIAAISGTQSNGREVLYLGNSPGSVGFAAGRTVLQTVLPTTGRLNDALVDPANAQDRVYGVSGDSGSPSFFEANGELVLVGHHYSYVFDQLIGLPDARDAVENHLAADGYVLDVFGEGHAGDPSAGELVVTGLTPDLRLAFDPDGSDADIVRKIWLHDFSGAGGSVTALVSGAGFALRVPGSTTLLQELALVVPASAQGVPLEVVFTPSTPDPASGFLQLGSDSGGLVVPLGDAPDPSVASLRVDPFLLFGKTGSGSVAGETRDFAVTLTNNDVAGRPSAEFSLTAGSPIARGVGWAPGWTVSFDRQTVTLAPGESTSINASVTPAPDSAELLFQFDLRAERASATTCGASARFFYLVHGTVSSP